MKIFNFHLMPYADVDLDAIDRHGSAWVDFSNSHYDPKKGAELYNRYLDEMEYADQLGFDGVVLNEHHQTAYGLMPTPGVLAGALSRSVKRAKIAILGRALPLLNNPLQVAEEFAILDNVTRGRFIAGFVRGIGAEYHAMGINPADSQERFAEAHDLIIRAWTQPGPFEYVGKHYDFRYVNPWPTPYQKPHPPIWIPSQGSGSTIRWAAAMRYTYCQTLSPIAMVAKFFQMYRDEAEKAGYQASPDQLAWSNTIYIAETDEKAIREAKPHLEALVNRLLLMSPQTLLPPGYTNVESMKAIRAKRSLSRTQTIDDLMKAGVVIVGSPNTVREKLAEYQDLAGFNTILTKTQFGTMPAEMTRNNMAAIAEEVLPHFRDRLPQPRSVASAAAE
ncbi:LLM class flavin-dependent oxidoreductase [Roseomonas chloroacetimidivorans]|uniref:LLM class flavin-dependent oxidoreductase n=1 Tax=Roseomonas chloroacetimidivorans TaxID=1766656 RepID=UPI003C737475